MMHAEGRAGSEPRRARFPIGRRGAQVDEDASHDLTEAAWATDSRLRECLDVMVEGVCILDAVRNARGTVVDFVLRSLNPAGLRFVTNLEVGHRVRDPLRLGGAGSLFMSYVAVVETGIPLNRRAEGAVGAAAIT